MFQTTTILSLKSDSQDTIDRILRRFNRRGYQVLRSFDLKAAQAAHIDCTCPHHGTDQCDCQMVVLLVYGMDDKPVTLVIHGQDGNTQVALVDTPEQANNQQNILTILGILQSHEPGPKKNSFSGPRNQ